MIEKPRRQISTLQFASQLRKLMKKHRLSVRETAQIAGVSGSVIQSWLSDAVPHDLEAVARLASKLKIGFKELILGTKEEIAEIPIDLLAQEQFEGICTLHISNIKIAKKEPQK